MVMLLASSQSGRTQSYGKVGMPCTLLDGKRNMFQLATQSKPTTANIKCVHVCNVCVRVVKVGVKVERVSVGMACL